MTAKEFINKNSYFILNADTPMGDTLKEAMIEFAKYHVEAAKKEYHRIILQEGLVTEAGIGYLDNAYSFKNIC